MHFQTDMQIKRKIKLYQLCRLEKGHRPVNKSIRKYKMLIKTKKNSFQHLLRKSKLINSQAHKKCEVLAKR